MGRLTVKRYVSPPPRPPVPLSGSLRRRKPRSYLEWKTLSLWSALPPWEDDPVGYQLRSARETVGVTQSELGDRLGCTQQAIAQAERWESNPTVGFTRRWARALGGDAEVRISLPARPRA